MVLLSDSLPAEAVGLPLRDIMGEDGVSVKGILTTYGLALACQGMQLEGGLAWTLVKWFIMTLGLSTSMMDRCFESLCAKTGTCSQ